MAAIGEVFGERTWSSAPGVLSNNISMNEKLAPRSSARNHGFSRDCARITSNSEKFYVPD